MPRAKKPDVVAHPMGLDYQVEGAERLPMIAAAKAVAAETYTITLKYSPEDMLKLDEFAIGLLGDTSRNMPGDGILESRIRAAYLRAEVMLTIRNEIAALEA